jgi:hypothetical protein
MVRGRLQVARTADPTELNKILGWLDAERAERSHSHRSMDEELPRYGVGAMTNVDGIVIPVSKTKTFLGTLGSLLFVVIGIAMVLTEHGILRIVGVVCTLFFGLCVVCWGRKLLDTRPGLVIDGEGIHDNSSAAPFGRLAWGEIAGFRLVEVRGQKMFAIDLRDPETFIQSAARIRKLAYRANMKLMGSPIAVTSIGLKIDHALLGEILTDSLKRHKIAAPADASA